MEIQSLSIVVPAKKCINNCKFCVARMHEESYKNQMDTNLPFYDLYFNDYMKRLEFARDNGCNTVMLTGNVEPQQNRQFLTLFGLMMRLMKKPFRTIEIQTTGAMIDRNYLRFLRNHVGVSTISLSLCSFDDKVNKEIRDSNLDVNIKELCALIKEYDFNLRLSLNLSDVFDKYAPQQLLKESKKLGADQVTFRKLYVDGDNAESNWIKDHSYKHIGSINPEYIEKIGGKYLSTLPFGAKQYMYDEMSVVVDDDCMSQEVKNSVKFLILRENCKLYSRWEDKASLIF